MKIPTEDLIAISSYPKKGQLHGSGTVGVASYTKNTLLALSKAAKKPPSIVVLAEILPGEEKEYQENNVRVVRCWQRNSWLAYWRILNQLQKSKTKKILIEFEMAMFGNPAINIFFPLLLFILRLIGKETSVVFHQVVLDFGTMTGHFGEKPSVLKIKILSLSSKIFFKLVGIFSNKIIVFEEFLKKRLSTIINSQRIIVIPHGVEPAKEIVNQQKARKDLKIGENDFVLEIFGFIAWYKGTDWLIDQFSNYLEKNPEANLKLIIAGGPNPNHLNKPFYQKYVNSIESMAKKNPKNISIAGFIDEKKIPLFHQAADLMIFPYRTGMSSSGPLALTFTYQKPFLVSQSLAELLETDDISKNLNKLKLSSGEISFSLDRKSFWGKVEAIRNDQTLKEKISKLGRVISNDRSWQNIGRAYYHLLLG